MRNNNIFRVILCLVVCCAGNLTGLSHTLTSPNGKLKVEVRLEEQLSYAVSHNDQCILSHSTIGIILDDGTMLGQNARITGKKVKKDQKDNVQSPFYRFSQFVVTYNELDLKFKGNFGLTFRVYNDGVAYRFYTTAKQQLTIKDEIVSFNFEDDHTVYLSHSTNEKNPLAMAFQNTYEAKPLSQASTQPAFLPATVDCGNGLKMTILESDLEAYPGMFVQAQPDSKSLKGIFSPLPAATDFYPWRKQEYIKTYHSNIARVEGKRTYPWRILAVTERDADMPVNNLVYALASPNRIGDYSWVKPGKVAWEWWNDWGLKGVDFPAGINMNTYMHYIDFASRNNIEYVILDEGWYDPKSGDMLKSIPQLDLYKLVQYAKERGVEIILWTVFNVLDSQLEAACKQYAELGIKGFKVDFLDRDDQTAVEMVYRIAEATARHKLLLDLHGIYKPTGLNRTYPHILNFEGVFGMEEVKWSSVEKDMPLYDVTFPYIRMMAGPVDYTPGAMRNATRKDFQPIYSNPMSMGTRCHQLAAYIVHDSPLTMLCDAPTNYDSEQQCVDFIVSIPVDIEETRILDGKMGEYIVTARRKGDTWYIGGMTNWTARSVFIKFDFLPQGKQYKVTLFTDGQNAQKQASDYKVSEMIVNSMSQREVDMAPGGGFAMRIQEDLFEDAPSLNTPPAALGIHSFYKKYLDADGIPVVASGNVRDEALIRARRVISQIVSKRPDIKAQLVKKGCKVMIIGENEEVCELPEYAHICNSPESIAYLNKRARGFGGAPEDEFSASFGEENVLGLPGDRYKGESIMVHEFAHIFHMVGILGVEPQFDEELEATRQSAIAKGLWKDTYCISNKEEYFAETLQSFFNCNQYAAKPNGVHNAINTREKLKLYDPDMYKLLLRYLPEIDLDLHE